MTIECHGLDTPERICFYEQDFYVLSNFSSFAITWKGIRFDTSEAAYHWEKFWYDNPKKAADLRIVRSLIRTANSAHEAYHIAQKYKNIRNPDWDKEDLCSRPLKVSVMKQILLAKVNQHEYVRRKLLQTGDRELVENSHRDHIWGWGPNRDGLNLLGKLWMEVREEIRSTTIK